MAEPTDRNDPHCGPCGTRLSMSCGHIHRGCAAVIPPDWADVREAARNAGWTRERSESGTTWGRFAFGAILDRSHGMAYVNQGNRRIYLAGPGGDERQTVVLYDPTPARVLAAARLVGLGGSDGGAS